MLYIVATPIGNLKDITERALEVLREAEYIVCEDTRRTSFLLRHFGIKKPLISYYEGNKTKRLPYIVKLLKAERKVCLVSDAGFPCISDPGFLIVRECIRQNLKFTVLPGAEAIIPALVLSGFPLSRFMFLGFLSHREGRRRKKIEELKQMKECTFVLYESPYRIVKLLSLLQEILPARLICVARELTKVHEEVIRGTAQDVYRVFAQRKSIKGEFVVVIAPAEFSF